MPDRSASSYDNIAAMYHALWADWYLPAAMPALERLFFSKVSQGSSVLDLCCGSGHVTKELVARGYQVTGVDNSAELIEIARRDLPAVDFRVQDIRKLALDRRYTAALCTFDSLNHILELDGIRQAFAGVFRSLAPGGLFVFDMNLEQAYSADLREWAVDLKPDSIGLVRGKFDQAHKKASTELIWLVRQPGSSCWRRQDSVVEQQCYGQGEIISVLSKGGFRDIESLSGPAAGVSADLGFGRAYFSARVPE